MHIPPPRSHRCGIYSALLVTTAALASCADISGFGTGAPAGNPEGGAIPDEAGGPGTPPAGDDGGAVAEGSSDAAGRPDTGITEVGAPDIGVGDAGGGCAAGPVASWHYAAGANLDANGGYPAGAVGFNLADVSSAGEASALPAGVMGLVWLGLCNGADAGFVAAVQAFAGNLKVFGFYLMDEPDPTGQWTTLCPIANLKAESDYIHTNLPGTKTFIVLLNLGSSSAPNYAGSYNPANSGIDLYGVDPYPCRTDLAGCDDSMITAAVPATLSAGIPLSAIVPVYQTFGGGGWMDDTGGAYLLPTPADEQTILAAWAPLVPTPVFDYAYAWGSQNGDQALSGSTVLQQTLAAHNTQTCGDP